MAGSGLLGAGAAPAALAKEEEGGPFPALPFLPHWPQLEGKLRPGWRIRSSVLRRAS